MKGTRQKRIEKGVILAAGLGARLRPLTNTVPKAMVEVGGKPLLWYQVQLLKFYGISEIWINLHWLPEQITQYFGDGSKFGVKIRYSYEKKLLGSAGALKNPESGIAEDLKGKSFVVSYADNLTNFDIGKLMDFHRQNKAIFTMGLFRSPEPWTAGVAELDFSGRVVKMVEKPPKEEIKSDLVNAGIYVCQPEVLDMIPGSFSDFGFDIIPQILKQKRALFGLETGSVVQDTGTWERLEKARGLVGQVFPFREKIKTSG